LPQVEPYVEELKQRVSSVTVYGSIQKLRRITQLIAPDLDLAWLMEIERDLFSEMRPKSKWDRVVLTELIIEAGLTLIAEAETAKKLTKLTRARMVRNGLMQALLAAYASTISVGKAQAQGVPVAVIQGASDPFGARLDGLLGMSFLARFSVSVSQNTIELTAAMIPDLTD
jgi:ribosomal protein S18 acetylase RimI-like enzyme